ncbi:erythromycin esterase, putative [Talaromyces stipitatus ATCC 10500]|uniref:Erythromycin esterase, putative n=1 Tax=Talaromyces stipitatus (strain ATCC 10500 / CBS 375.48 / QM 6759 / NRRL 1006) TaxID=441959 RepID=B8M871_TALSN|nr:erythromycin esterase, putative [Talaromyces stipitatus ATCC 10500]EED20034.1 erythromycin esterase, putative [Talaromyces stipitatus ATCC 10500]
MPGQLTQLVQAAAKPLPEIKDPLFGQMFDTFRNYKVVLLGDGSHGTSEFYSARAEITKHLVDFHGFNMIALEADWPDAEAIDRYVRLRPGPKGRIGGKSKIEPFKRFPTWMWRNREMQDLVEWMRDRNAKVRPEERAGFYGLDLYSMGESIKSVIQYLDLVDPELGKNARKRYGCLQPWVDDPASYGLAALQGMENCESKVVHMLKDLLKNRLEYSASEHDGEAFHSAEQNAHVVRDAEKYYKAMYYSSASSWTLRDTHMFDTLDRLFQFKPPNSKAIVWAHNSHVGDARFTSMGQRRKEINIGQLCRERYGRENVAIIGCGTHTGTVAAAHEWDEDMEVMRVNPSRTDSWEYVAHSTGIPNFLLDLRPDFAGSQLREAFAQEPPKLERFIGVIYRPDTERVSHYSQAYLHNQLDAMAPRRSARLRGNTPLTEDQFPEVPTTTPKKLSPVAENDETKIKDTDPKPNTTPKSQSSLKKAILSPNGKPSIKTPSTVGAVRPAHEEMHPSKVHQSTTKQADSGLILGFQPIKRDSNGRVIKEDPVTNTPSKIISSPPSNLGTPSKFGFKFSSDDAQLSEEARKLMASVREDVARIKAQMILERGEQQRNAEAAEQPLGNRKIIKPKGKAGRFSDVHMAEFKKMDSIAGHPSAFRAQPGRFTPATQSLKRKSSKAKLDEPEAKPAPSKSPGIAAKRVKRAEIQTTSTTRPLANIGTQRKTGIPQPGTSMFRSSSLMTPTKSSTARFASARPSKTSMIPSLAGSPSRPAVPQTPKTEFNPRLKKSLPSLGNLKSILRRRQPLFSTDPAKIAAGTHITAPNFSPDIDLKGLPTATFGSVDQTPSPKKHVEFTSSTKSPRESILETPTAIGPASDAPVASTSDIMYPTLPLRMTPDKEVIDTPTIRRVRESITAAQPASPLPKIPAIPHGIPNKERKHDHEKEQTVTLSSPTFNPTFSTHPTASPFPKMPTVPHGIPNEKRGREEHSKKPDIKSTDAMLKAPISPLKAKSPSICLVAVPHGIVNKKRQRADVSDDEDTENIPPADDERNAKRLKASPMKLNPVSPSPIKKRPIITPGRMTGNRGRGATPGTASKKSVLSLSRLNMLSKPKSRS